MVKDNSSWMCLVMEHFKIQFSFMFSVISVYGLYALGQLHDAHSLEIPLMTHTLRVY